MTAKKLRVAVYTMAKNEINHVKRFADSCRDADCVVVTDTGSTDGTQDALRKEGVTVHEAAILPWRFDLATNVAMSMVPADVDCCIKMDLDEVLTPNWRAELEELWVGKVNRLSYWYTWNWAAPGVPGVRMLTTNIHGRHGFIWRHAGHAALCSTVPNYRADAKSLEIHHYMVQKNRPNYLPLLELAVTECRCPRTLYYVGREYHFNKLDDKCITAMEAYLAMPDAKWKAQRAEAMRYLALSYQRKKMPDMTLSWLMRANSEWPGMREIWYEILRHFSMIGDWEGGRWAARRCLAVTKRDEEFCVNTPDPWFDRPYEFAAVCSARAGYKDEAATYLVEAVKVNPGNPAWPKLAEEFGIKIFE